MTDKLRRLIANPTDEVYSEKLLLPSFGIGVSRSAPSAVAVPTGWGNADFSVDGGDAFSVSYLRESSNVSTANQDFVQVDPAYLRRILLRVLYEEEYEWIEEHHTQRNLRDLQGFGTKPLADRQNLLSGPQITGNKDRWAQVRLTDLRLAKDIKPAHLKRELKSSMPGLPVPLTNEGVVGWKWETLRKPKGLREPADLIKNDEWYEEEQVRIEVVSFAAAALLLLLDLDMHRLKETPRNGLEEQVKGLFELIKELIDKLDRSVDELSKFLAGRKGTTGGRPSDPPLRYYVALSLYRMGRPAKDIAWRVDILSPEQRDSMKKTFSGQKDNEIQVPKNWTTNLRGLVKRGVEIEKEMFPRAAEVFARKDEEWVRAKAVETYRDYLETDSWEEVGQYVGSVGIGDDLLSGGIPVDQRDEVYKAFVQLGSCLENGIDPLPTTTTAVKLFS
jgi:hypothetical protein